MAETEQALMALVKGVVALSEATRELASTGDPDDLQIAALKARTAEITASISRLKAQPVAAAAQVGEVPEPMATSASSRPTKVVESLDDIFGNLGE
ncbi:MAG: hypothetical protein AAGG01_06320 [Planctomycetota bacterium]